MMPFAIVGPTDQIKEAFSLNRYDEHCKGWRWHMYVQDSDKRMDAVMAEVRKMAAERRTQEAFAEAAE